MTNKTGLYPVEVVARVLNLTPRRVQQLARSGVIPPARRGRYALASSISGYCRYLQEQLQRRAPDAEAGSRLKLLAERVRRLKLDNDQREARLIPREHAEAILEEIVAITVLCNHSLLRPELVNELVGMDQPAMIRTRLKDEVRAVRQELADRLEALGKKGRAT